MTDPPSPSSPLRPVIVVTGSNSGVGFGICQRLILQLSNPTPSDTLPCHPSLAKSRYGPDGQSVPSPFSAANGFTLVLACRNPLKANVAVKKLQALLHNLAELRDDAELPLSTPDATLTEEHPHVDGIALAPIDPDKDQALEIDGAQEKQRARRRARTNQVLNGQGASSTASAPQHVTSEDSGDLTPSQEHALREKQARLAYRRSFCKGTRIEVVSLDLGSMASALNCAKEIRDRYHYVTHVILNAGGAAFTGLNWPLAAWMVLTNLKGAVTWPHYKTQRSGDIGADGHGWVWQCNVGAHYILVRALLPALRASPYSVPSRIIWTGSIEAFGRFYSPEDYQCKDPAKSPNPYESTKYQCELAALGLDERLQGDRLSTHPSSPTLQQPQVDPWSSSEMEPRSFLTHPGVVASSIFAEFLNYWLIQGMILAFYTARWLLSPHHPIEAYKGAIAACHVALAPAPSLEPRARYGSRCDFWGREYVHAGRIDGWEGSEAAAAGPSFSSTSKEAGREPDGVTEALLHNGHSGGGASEDSIESDAPTGGAQRVMQLARDLIEKCEAIAAQTWAEAREGALPPFKVNEASGRELGAGLLPPRSRGQSGEHFLSPNVDASRKAPSSGSSEKDEWEKVEHAL